MKKNVVRRKGLEKKTYLDVLMLVHEIFLTCAPLHSVVPSPTTAKNKNKKHKKQKKK